MLRAAIVEQRAVTADETGWRVGGLGAWLWAFVAAEVAVYAIREGRSFDDATAVLPADWAGTLVRDGWAPYRKFTEAVHQSRLAHLLRRAAELRRANPPGARDIPDQLTAILHDALTLRAARDAGALDRDGLAAALADLGRRLDALLARRPRHATNRRLLKHLHTERDALLTFLAHTGLDATNWRAEQAIRPAVVNRKVWGGNRTWRGAHTQQVLMTLFRTAAQQGHDAVAILVELCAPPAPPSRRSSPKDPDLNSSGQPIPTHISHPECHPRAITQGHYALWRSPGPANY